VFKYYARSTDYLSANTSHTQNNHQELSFASYAYLSFDESLTVVIVCFFRL